MTSCSNQHAEQIDVDWQCPECGVGRFIEHDPGCIFVERANNAALERNLGKLAADPLDQSKYLPYNSANTPPIGALAVVRVPMLGKTDGSFTLLLAEYNAMGFRCPRMWSAIRGVMAYRILPESWIVK